MRHLLVTTDLSTESECAVKFAEEQGRLDSGPVRVTLLTIYDDAALENFRHRFGKSLSTYDDFKPHVEARLQELASIFPPNVQCDLQFLPNGSQAEKDIATYARSRHISEIFIATHGRTGFKHLLLGSVVEGLIREVICPIFVVPAREGCSHTVLQTVPTRLILCLTDFSPESASVFPIAQEQLQLYQGHDVQLMLFHVIEDLLKVSFHHSFGSDPEAIWMERSHAATAGLERIRDHYFPDSLALTTVMRQERLIGEDIVKFAESRGVALIILGTHGWKGLRRKMLGSVAETVARMSKCPVLVVPATEHSS